MSTALALAEVVASGISLLITNKFETRKIVATFAGISSIATVAIMLLNAFTDETTHQALIAVGYLVQYTGFVTTFNFVYLLINDLFPTILLATAYGACNVVGRAIAIGSPIVARVQPPYPMSILACYSILCAVLPFLLITIKRQKSASK